MRGYIVVYIHVDLCVHPHQQPAGKLMHCFVIAAFDRILCYIVPRYNVYDMHDSHIIMFR